MFKTFARKITEIFLPPLCLACGKYLRGNADILVCAECLAAIEIHNSVFCSLCSRRLPAENKPCVHKDFSFILAAAAPYRNKTVRELIHALKYRSGTAALIPLSNITSRYMEKIKYRPLTIKNSVIVPIPLYRSRERKRGYNQSLRIALLLRQSHPTGAAVPVETDALIKIKNTPPQSKTNNRAERMKNMAGSFKIKNSAAVRGKNIILIDDVYTSGATMNEAARILKKAGAKQIIGFVIAKT